MAREKPDYRQNLELINAVYPGKAALNYLEISQLFGYSKVTAQRKWGTHFNKICSGVPVTTIARLMCA